MSHFDPFLSNENEEWKIWAAFEIVVLAHVISGEQQVRFCVGTAVSNVEFLSTFNTNYQNASNKCPVAFLIF